MNRKLVRHHVRAYVSAKHGEVVDEYRTLGPGEHPSGPATQWLAMHGISIGNNSIAETQAAHERLTDAICMTIPESERSVEKIHDWLGALKVMAT